MAPFIAEKVDMESSANPSPRCCGGWGRRSVGGASVAGSVAGPMSAKDRARMGSAGVAGRGGVHRCASCQARYTKGKPTRVENQA